MKKLLIIDDEVTICSSLRFALEDEYDVEVASNSFELDEAIKTGYFDVVLLDLKFGNILGTDILPILKDKFKDVVVIIMTAYASIESSIEAMKLGAYDYIIKPIDITKLKFILGKSIEFKMLNEKISYLEEAVLQKNRTNNIIGKSKKIESIFMNIDKIKNIDCGVLIFGNSGTGKELVAREIHFNGNRKHKPFEVVNCGAIPSNLVESELFGYEKGAFTGATANRKGLFELADGGTLFLDEIGEMDLLAQVKLLRAIQAKEIFPLGAEKSKKIDVRIIAATNKDLSDEVKKGKFREDLFFRLNVVVIKTPNLKERIDDLPLLIEHFIKESNREFGKDIKRIDKRALSILEHYEFPGNVRELKNIIERAVIFSTGDSIDVDSLPENLKGNLGDFIELKGDILPVKIGSKFSNIEKSVILKTLEYAGGNRKKTAGILGISERNLRYKLKMYNESE